MVRSRTPAARLAKLSATLRGAKTLLIVVQNNPDPDAIAAAAALREIARALHGIACSVAHAGTVGRAENQAILRYLGLNTRPLSGLELDRFDRIAMVDAQPGAGNVNFDPAVKLDIVIDHHPIRRETRSARFTDIRSRYGATSTLMHQYLKAAGITIDPPLATALVYGIRSDTQDLGRESTKADVEAFLDLYPHANARVLGRIVSAQLPRRYFAALRQALDNASVYGDRVVSFLDTTYAPEMIAEIADLLLRVEGAAWSMCLGVIDGWVHVSLRSSGSGKPAGFVARHLGGRRGFGGGHNTLAAAQIPLPAIDLDRRAIEHTITGLVKRFLNATGPSGIPGSLLCDDDR
jgi:nanoRNase/pAp phosphatase (c-di-AMP/oligoRNAs hydrolase)